MTLPTLYAALEAAIARDDVREIAVIEALEGVEQMQIARVFPRRTKATPDDALAWALKYRPDGSAIWETAMPPLLAMPEIDEVHISVAFTWDRWAVGRLERYWRDVGVPVKIGGPAFGLPGGEFTPGLYLKQGYTITSRGCPKNCWHCGVPGREGPWRALPISDGWNLLDDNLLAGDDDHIEAVFQMLDRQPQRAVFTGGLEPSFLQPWHARRMREIKAKRMYFAYDTPDDYDPLVQAGKTMRQEGHRIESHSMACYVLVGYKGDTFDRAEKRLVDTVKAGFVPYAMLYRDKDGDKDPDWAKFQREWLRPEIVGTKMREIRKEAPP